MKRKNRLKMKNAFPLFHPHLFGLTHEMLFVALQQFSFLSLLKKTIFFQPLISLLLENENKEERKLFSHSKSTFSIFMYTFFPSSALSLLLFFSHDNQTTTTTRCKVEKNIDFYSFSSSTVIIICI